VGRVWAAMIATLWLLPSVPSWADETPVTILAGRWTYDATRSRVVDPDLKITTAAAGTLRAEGIPGAPYEFDPAGGSRPLPNGRAIVWTPTSHDTWQVTRSKSGDVLETITVTLSGNTLHNVTHGTLPDGSPYQRTVTYRRVGPGEGLVGLWRSVKVDTGATWDGFVISTAGNGVVTWRVPTDLQTITGHFDGSDLAIVGPKGPTGSTMAFQVAGPRRFDYVIKNGAQVAQRGTITLSRDQHWLTDLSWSVDQPTRKSALVYKRDR
jgi:hypothetical protein